MKARVVNLHKEPYDVLIDRTTKWGNPFIIGKGGNRFTVILKYKQYVMNNAELLNHLHELTGKRLGCSCAPRPCHGDVLVNMLEDLGE